MREILPQTAGKFWHRTSLYERVRGIFVLFTSLKTQTPEEKNIVYFNNKRVDHFLGYQRMKI